MLEVSGEALGNDFTTLLEVSPTANAVARTRITPIKFYWA